MRYTDDELLALLPRLLRADKAGRLFWLHRSVEMFVGLAAASSWNSRYAGKEAFRSLDSAGRYYEGRIFGRKYLAHRVVFALAFGRWPNGALDHIDHNGLFNAPENLREASASDNSRNKTQNANNTSGVTGVCWAAHRKKWLASIGIGGRRRKHLGLFERLEDAVAARQKAERQLGYHPNHGARAA